MKDSLKIEMKTWDGVRWSYVIFAVIFGLICAHLINQGALMLLLSIPAILGFVSVCLALFGSDSVLKKIASFVPFEGF